MARFRAAAAGAGVVPWRHDLAGLAEDWFHRLAAPPAPQQRTLSLAGARILAGQLRECSGACRTPRKCQTKIPQFHVTA